MTATEHMSRVRIPGGGVVLAPIGRALVLRWAVNTHAVREALPASIAGLGGRAERLTTAALEWRIDGERAVAGLRLAVGGEDVVLPLAEARGRWIVDGDREHADFGGPLRLTRIDGRTVWARTDLLGGVLGLRGGVYEGPFEG